MAEPEAAVLDLRALRLDAGAAIPRELPVAVEPLTIGGQEYVVDPPAPTARVELSRSLSGLHARLRLEARLVGPCWRCVEPARVPLRVDAREFQAAGREDAEEFDEDLDSAHLSDERLDLGAWVRDALAEVVPPAILCREDCAGLCPTCGADLNAGGCGCAPAPADSRWAALRDLAERLEGAE